MEKILRTTLPGGRFRKVPVKRSRIMRAIPSGGNRSTEVRFRLGMVRRGIRGWKLRPEGLVGNPDFYFPGIRLAVFVDGCFWHGCPLCGHIPKKNTSFWETKIHLNKLRDREKTHALRLRKIVVLRFWEHEVESYIDECVHRVRDARSKALGKKHRRVIPGY